MTDLTLGTICYDDYDGVYFTVQSARMYHPKIKIIVVDNNPDSVSGQAVKKLCNFSQDIRYIPFNEYRGTSIKNKVFEYSETKYTLYCDCHVIFSKDSIQSLIDYYKKNPETLDLVQGPLLHDDLKTLSTNFKTKDIKGDPLWSSGMLGQWGFDHQYFNNKPFEIEAQGMGVFSCKTDSWLGFNKKMRGFGGEECYIHEKYRQEGRKTICVPQLKWVHRFDRPNGVPYPNVLEERLRNYIIGHREVGWDEKHLYEHFYKVLGTKKTDIQKNKMKNFNLN